MPQAGAYMKLSAWLVECQQLKSWSNSDSRWQLHVDKSLASMLC